MKKRKGCMSYILAVVLAVGLLYFTVGNGKTEIAKKIYPVKYQEYVEKSAEEYALDKYLVYAVIKTESNFDPEAKSHAGAKGIMQLMDTTAAECNIKESFGYTIPEDLFEPEKNIRIGCSYLRELLNTYGDIELAITAYNAGTGNVKKWLGNDELSDGEGGLAEIPYEETEKYVKKVLRTYELYTKLYKENSF